VQPSLGRVSGPSGETQLEPRAIELLLFLADRAGEVVSRRQILDGVWKQEFVADVTVSSTVAKLRRALGDDARAPRYVETLTKRGYLLLMRPLPALQVVAAADGPFRVGEWLVEPGLARMTRGDAEVQLDRGAMDVLLCLAERAGEPVPRQELAGRAWRDEPVSDLALSRRIEELEEALAGGAAGSRYIEAVPDRGYRLAAAVAAAQPGATVTPFPGVQHEPERPVFVGREAELERLDAFLHQALAGEGRVAFVTGEAGTGKTALVQELLRQAQGSHDDLVAAVGLCSDQTGIGDPYAPWRQVLALLTGDVDSGSAGGTMSAESARRLWRASPLTLEAVTESGRDLVDTLLPGKALLARAEAAATPGAPWHGPLRELVQRKASLPPDLALQQAAVFMQVARVLAAVARRRPLLLVLEDLHWADAGSIALLFHLGREVAGHPIFLLGTYRPTEVALGRAGERHPLEAAVAELKARHGRLEVDLGQAASRAFVDAYVDSEPNRLDDGFRASLNRQTAGHALFTVETLRALQEQGIIRQDPEGLWVEGEGLDWATLPERVEGVLAARVERLPDDLRDLLAVASVEGEDFTAEVVARVRGSDPREVVRLLSRELEARHRLVRAHGVRVLPTSRLSRFGFSHVLFQRYLYGTLNEVERAQLHEDVGTALETLYGSETDEVAVELAHHFERAGIVDKAVHYLLHAGLGCVHRTANLEAIGHLWRALELLATLPESDERDRQEMLTHLVLQAPLIATQGWASGEVGASAERALELTEGMADEEEVGPALFNLATFFACRAEYHRAIALAERMLDLARRRGDEVQVAMAHWILAWPSYFVGRYEAGRGHAEHVVAFYDPERHAHLRCLYGGFDPGVACLGHLSWILLHLGFLDAARQRAEECLALAERLGHPLSLAFALWLPSWVYVWRGEHATVRPLADRLLAVATEHRFPDIIALAEIDRRWLEIEQGVPDARQPMIHNWIAALETMGYRTTRGARLVLSAEEHHRLGLSERALEILEEAQQQVERHDERGSEPLLYLVRGEILLDGGATAEAEASFTTALEVARGQKARYHELLAATALARLWQGQGKRREARELLRPVCEAFTEGLDTAPLQEARALLGELAYGRNMLRP